MISVIRSAPDDATHNVRFTYISPAGFHILAVLEQVADRLGHDLTITSACDGDHSGPEDPHHLGKAFDVRTHDHPDPNRVVELTQLYLGTQKFYAFLEDAGTPNEHMHVQLRHGIMYP